MTLQTVNYLRLPMWALDETCKQSCNAALIPVDEAAVQDALWQYDKNHDHVLGPDDALDAPLRKRGIVAVGGVPTTSLHIADLFIAAQYKVGRNRFFSSADDVIRFAKAAAGINIAYDNVQWLKSLNRVNDDSCPSNGANYSNQNWPEIKKRFGMIGLQSMYLDFSSLKSIKALGMEQLLGTRTIAQSQPEADISAGVHFFRIMPRGIPYRVQQQLVEMMIKYIKINSDIMALKLGTVACCGADCPDAQHSWGMRMIISLVQYFSPDTSSYPSNGASPMEGGGVLTLTLAEGVAIFLQRDPRGLNFDNHIPGARGPFPLEPLETFATHKKFTVEPEIFDNVAAHESHHRFYGFSTSFSK